MQPNYQVQPPPIVILENCELFKYHPVGHLIAAIKSKFAFLLNCLIIRITIYVILLPCHGMLFTTHI